MRKTALCCWMLAAAVSAPACDPGGRGEELYFLRDIPGGPVDAGVYATDAGPPADARPDGRVGDRHVPAPDTMQLEDLPGVETGGEDAVTVADALEDGDAPDGPICPAPCEPEVRPILFVHGYAGGPENWEVMIERLTNDGWPPEYLVAFEAEDPSWTCNVDNAAVIAQMVEQLRAATCHDRIDLLAHSMGALSSRYYLKFLGGTGKVNSYVTLAGMHHGLVWSCLAPDFLEVCVWQEICEDGEFIAQLDADTATPGALHWVSIYSQQDVVVPWQSSDLDGAENIAFEGLDHDGPDGVLQDLEVYAEVRRVLDYPCW